MGLRMSHNSISYGRAGDTRAARQLTGTRTSDGSMPKAAFNDLVRRLRAGEEAAVREFVAAYEPFVRRTIRRRLMRSRLGSAAGATDVCQSVLGSFLIRLAVGEYELETQDDLSKLLMTIARNKVAALARREQAECRDRSITWSLGSSANVPANPADEPSRQAAGKELLAEVQRRLSKDERELFLLRQQGLAWDAVAARLGEPQVLLRKRLSRGLHRVAHQLGLEDDDG
jgi:RNA polymerase sigma factor (sigma-70 family)